MLIIINPAIIVNLFPNKLNQPGFGPSQTNRFHHNNPHKQLADRLCARKRIAALTLSAAILKFHAAHSDSRNSPVLNAVGLAQQRYRMDCFYLGAMRNLQTAGAAIAYHSIHSGVGNGVKQPLSDRHGNIVFIGFKTVIS